MAAPFSKPLGREADGATKAGRAFYRRSPGLPLYAQSRTLAPTIIRRGQKRLIAEWELSF
jgi:hypothetical protein